MVRPERRSYWIQPALQVHRKRITFTESLAFKVEIYEVYNWHLAFISLVCPHLCPIYIKRILKVIIET